MLRWCWAHRYVSENVAGEGIDGALRKTPAVKQDFRALPSQVVAGALEAVANSRAINAVNLCPVPDSDSRTSRRSAGRDLGGGGHRSEGMADSW